MRTGFSELNMKKLLTLALLFITAVASAGPLFVPSTNGTAWGTTVIAPGFTGTALTVKSNLSLGIQGSISWAETAASVRVAHDIHGANRDVLSLDGGPDVVISQASFGSTGGGIQFGNHSLPGGDAYLAYAGSPGVNLPGHSLPLGFEALFNAGAGNVYSKFTFVGRPGTNIVSNGWANGYLEGWDVPPLWNNTTSILPDAEAGRRLFKWGREGLFLDAGGFYGSNLKSGSGSPEGVVTGIVGDIYQRLNGAENTTLYVKTSGTGNTGWQALLNTASGLSNPFAVAATPQNITWLAPDPSNMILVTNTSAASQPVFRVDGSGNAFMANQTVSGSTTLSSLAGSGDRFLYINNTEVVDQTTAPGALQSVRRDAAGTGWENFTPFTTSGGTLSGALAVNQGTITDPANALAITGTWNDAADTFIGIDANFTSTASAAQSLVHRWRIGGTTVASINKSGGMRLGTASTADPGAGTLYAVDVQANNLLQLYKSSVNKVLMGNISAIELANDYPVLWSSTTAATGAKDLGLARSAANLLEVNNGTTGTASGDVAARGFWRPSQFVATAGFTFTATNDVVASSGTTLTHTLPTAVGIKGKPYTVINLDATAVTIARTSAQTINGVAGDFTITTLLSKTFLSDGANWLAY